MEFFEDFEYKIEGLKNLESASFDKCIAELFNILNDESKDFMSSMIQNLIQSKRRKRKKTSIDPKHIQNTTDKLFKYILFSKNQNISSGIRFLAQYVAKLKESSLVLTLGLGTSVLTFVFRCLFSFTAFSKYLKCLKVKPVKIGESEIIERNETTVQDLHFINTCLSSLANIALITRTCTVKREKEDTKRTIKINRNSIEDLLKTLSFVKLSKLSITQLNQTFTEISIEQLSFSLSILVKLKKIYLLIDNAKSLLLDKQIMSDLCLIDLILLFDKAQANLFDFNTGSKSENNIQFLDILLSFFNEFDSCFELNIDSIRSITQQFCHFRDMITKLETINSLNADVYRHIRVSSKVFLGLVFRYAKDNTRAIKNMNVRTYKALFDPLLSVFNSTIPPVVFSVLSASQDTNEIEEEIGISSLEIPLCFVQLFLFICSHNNSVKEYIKDNMPYKNYDVLWLIAKLCLPYKKELNSAFFVDLSSLKEFNLLESSNAIKMNEEESSQGKTKFEYPSDNLLAQLKGNFEKHKHTSIRLKHKTKRKARSKMSTKTLDVLNNF